MDFEIVDTMSTGEEDEVYLDQVLQGARLFAKNESKITLGSIDIDLGDIDDSHLGYLLLSLVIAVIWAVYIMLFHSRIQGCILTIILRKFIKKGKLSVGSFSMSVISGKIMFRNVSYVTEDYSFRVVDGILKFRYWLLYTKKSLYEDMSHCDYRIWLELNGPEIHIYNRSKVYGRLEELYGMERSIIIEKKNADNCDPEENDDLAFWRVWRDLIPVVKIEMNMARFVFGNRLIPSTLLLTVEKAECQYSTKAAACNMDHFMHTVTVKGENFKVILSPSPKYTGVTDEPPRFMGEGLVVLSSSIIHLYHYMDQPGKVRAGTQTVQLPNGDEVAAPAPVWGLDIKCENRTNLCYGPWADRQREKLFKFFFPPDYQVMEVTNAPVPGEVRKIHQFDVRFSVLSEATVDILFSKEKETSAMHLTIQRGSYFEMTLPWIVVVDGTCTSINGQLFHADSSTGLLYRSLLEAETLDYSIMARYPRVWNQHQNWDITFNGSKATYHFIYQHKNFFQDLIEDWSSRSTPDLLHFVPYTWNFAFHFSQFELVTLSNEHNWVDCSSQNQANAHVGFCGDKLDFKFALIYTDFLPEKVFLNFSIMGKSVDLSLYLPPSNTSRNIISSLDRNSMLPETGHLQQKNKWRRYCKLSNEMENRDSPECFSVGWIDCWSVPDVQVNLGYTYHPSPPLGPSPQANVTTPEKEELLLSPIRAPHSKKSPLEINKLVPPEEFYPTSLAADILTVDVQILRYSEIKLYGAVLRHFVHLKDNIFGCDQKFTDMDDKLPDDSSELPDDENATLVDEKPIPFDCRKYRQFSVTVNVDIRNVRGFLMKDCSVGDSVCPTAILDRLVFEMDKRYEETKLQVIISPVILLATDKTQRPSAHSHLGKGFVLLSGLQLRGHAMFSSEELTLDEETLEYAWLMELTVGTLSSHLTPAQLHNVVMATETFLFTLQDEENCLRQAKPYLYCYHGNAQPNCVHTTAEHFCPTVDQIKYKMLRVSIDGLDIHLVESGTDLNLQVSPIRLSTCNLHGQHTRSGVTASVHRVKLQNFVCTQMGVSGGETSLAGASTPTVDGSAAGVGEGWMQVAAISLGPLHIDAAVSTELLHHDMQIIQHRFLKLHDERTKRLWFLWPQELTEVPSNVFGKCGCVGGCIFFGENRNGVKFFVPTQQDVVDGVNVALFRVNEIGESPGYGQSILQKANSVFPIDSYSSHFIRMSESRRNMGHVPVSSGFTDHLVPISFETHRQSSVHFSDPQHGYYGAPPTICIPSTRAYNPRLSYQREVSEDSDNAAQVEGETADSSFKTWPQRNKNSLPPHDPLGTSSLSELRTKDADTSLAESLNSVDRASNVAIVSRPLSDDDVTLGADSPSALTSPSSQRSLFLSAQRTLSFGSEAEAFFSADEDQLTINDRGSLSSVSLPPGQDVHGTSYSEIVITGAHSVSQDGDRMSGSMNSLQTLHDVPDGTGQLPSMHSSHSDKDINHVEHILRQPKNQTMMDENNADDDRDMDSVSSTSFISAISSQEELAMVDLHVQLNKPITESPLLMSSYVNHMTQMRCLNWDAPEPTFTSSNSCPLFETLTEGFTSIRMVDRDNPPSPSSLPPPSVYQPTHPYSWDIPVFTWGGGPTDESTNDDTQDIVSLSMDSTTSRTTIIMKLKKDIDITLSPIALESAQLLIEALTPLLETLHPLAIVNRAHLRSVAHVGAQNILKKERYLYWSRLWDRKIAETPGESQVLSTTYEETFFKQLQGQVTIPRINISILQASVVEEVISFAALDNIRDLTCVSLCCVCIDGIALQFSTSGQEKRSVQMLMRNPHESGIKKKVKSKKRQTVDLLDEPVYIESSEKKQVEHMVSLKLKRVHAQLRRLKNESVLLKEAAVTAIPAHRSKVLFTFQQESAETLEDISTTDNLLDEDLMGFIMFEAGLENLTLKAIKRDGFGGKKTDDHPLDISTSRASNATTGHFGPDIPTASGNTSAEVPTSGCLPDFGTKVKVNEKHASTSRLSNISTNSGSGKSGDGIAVQEEPKELPTSVAIRKGKKDLTSLDVELKNVWFNFAAPPQIPITKKIDYTRLDWNLLSTVSPSVNAWMNPSDRVTLAIIQLFRSSESRRLGVMAALMAEALDDPSIHVPIKNKYVKLTPLSKTLQEDPSCQLCTVLRRFLQSAMPLIENNLAPDYLPQLVVLRQGVVVLSRQWKNALYMPLLMEQTFRNKQSRPTLQSRLSIVPEVSAAAEAEAELIACAEVTEEEVNLLQAEDGSVNSHKASEQDHSSASREEITEGVLSSESSQLPPKRSLPHFPLRSFGASMVFPTPGIGLPESPRLLQLLRGTNLPSPKGDDGHVRDGSPVSAFDRTSLASRSYGDVDRRDLYSWMAKQQDFTQARNVDPPLPSQTAGFPQGDRCPSLPSGGHPHITFLEPPDPPSVGQFLEAHVIFQPLLSAIGVVAQQVNGGALEQLGSNVSLAGCIDSFRVDIIESEESRLNRRKCKSGARSGRFQLDITCEIPAFLCEHVGVEIEFSQVPDNSAEWVLQQPALFVSRSALKQHTTSVMHFSLAVNYVAQQVNVTLLRLLHQISSVYENAVETQVSLRERRPSHSRDATNRRSRQHERSFSECREQDSKPERSFSVSEEHVTVSTPMAVGAEKAIPRGSVISGASIRASPPPPISAKVNRPQSFAQHFRSSTRKGRGSSILSSSMSGSGLEAIVIGSDKSPILEHHEPPPTPSPAPMGTPKCWRNIYYLLDLYTTTPETKTVKQRRSSTVADFAEGEKVAELSELEDVETGRPNAIKATPLITNKTRDIVIGSVERTPLVVFGVVKIQRIKLLASLSGLKLEAEMTAVHSSLTYREKVRGTRSSVRSTQRTSSELSHTGYIGSTMIVLLEGIPPNQQTVVRVTIAKSQGMYSSLSRKAKDNNSALITIGDVNIDIPQHPIILHDMMTRGTKQLSSTLQELRVSRPSARLSRGTTLDEPDLIASPRPYQEPSAQDLSPSDSILNPLVVQFSVLLKSLCIQAALLPSLQAQYRMEQVSSVGVTGSKARFSVHLPTHHLSFSTRLEQLPSEGYLPPSASIQLPQVHVEAEYIQDDATAAEQQSEGMVLKQGSYLSAKADIGSLEHSLTTDLLNHLVFVQKVFMKEVNEVVQKMAGSDKPVSLWSDESPRRVVANPKRLLFTLQLRFKGIIITATTPTQSAVRLETGDIELHLSNRVENISRPSYSEPGLPTKIFGKAQVSINVALGQLIRNDMFEEAEPEFQQLAFFRTRISVRNAFHDEMESVGEEGEVVLMTLTRPLVCVQPQAVDRAVLVWLNYKNAYEYWSEQRASLNKEVLTATQQVFEKVPQFSSLSSAANIKNNLFLQLTVDDIGICLPLNPCRTLSHQVDTTETRDALVVTLESTIISACNSASLVCKARFRGFCLRFAPDFETGLDDWKPDVEANAINLCVVSEGTYEVCSRTLAQNPERGINAKWILNVQWQMEGMDLHLDVNIGKHLSSLARTLTVLTESEEDYLSHHECDSDGDTDNVDYVPSQEATLQRRQTIVNESLPAFIFDPTMDARQRAKLLEIEMNEQVKTVNDLKVLGASSATIEQEVRRLQELETVVFHDFRRDVIKRLRRQSVRASSVRDRFGLGVHHPRSKSLRVPTPTMEMRELPTHHESQGSSDQLSFSEENSPQHATSHQRVKFSDTPFRSSDSTDSHPLTEEVDGNEVFISSPKKMRNGDDSSCESDIGESDFKLRVGSAANYGRLSPVPPKLKGTSSMGSRTSIHSSTAAPPSTLPPKPQDPSIDLELDVRVCISSGKCNLYSKPVTRDKEDESKSKLRKDKSFTGGFSEPQSSPGSLRKKNELRHISSSSKLRMPQPPLVTSTGETVFFIPGLDVKIHYESHNAHEDSPSDPPYSSPHGTFSQSPMGSQVPLGSRKSTLTGGAPSLGGGTKRASLFTWLTLQSIQEETTISPNILEFLELALEPIALPETQTKQPNSAVSQELEPVFSVDDASTSVSSGAVAYASFPVDVIVYFHMQPSTIRFSCLPLSRVECVLQLPSLNLVFSSKRAEADSDARDFQSRLLATIGGLSVTGVLEDFSLFVFHPFNPYGDKTRGGVTPGVGSLSDAERKDSLSMMVEFVKFHISRSRKTKLKSLEGSKGKGDPGRAIIRFSALIDIGTANFKYDMRRLAEILAFPRAWYRKTIVRRLFLGDFGGGLLPSEVPSEAPSPGSDSPGMQRVNKVRSSMSSDGLEINRDSGTNQLGTTAAPGSQARSWEKFRLDLDPEVQLRRNKSHASPKNGSDVNGATGGVSPGGDRPTTQSKPPTGSWETLVTFAVNFTRLNVQMNMGNVMGNVVWTTKDFKADGRLSIGSSGHKNLYIGLGLGGSGLDAKGGIVGGTIELAEINMYLQIHEDPCTEPDHTIGLKLFAAQSRLDYMGTSVVMARVSSFSVTLKDEWRLKQCANESDDDATRRGSTIFILGDLEWDQLQLLISKSTTSDLLKMHHKLEEFFSQQFKSSKRVFSSLQPTRHKASIKHRKDTNKKLPSAHGTANDGRHHRHWQDVLAKVSGLQLATLPLPLPASGTVLGGSVELHGRAISLGCFHGVNFKSKSWALFSLKEPYINFMTEGQEVPGEVPRDTHVVQNLTFSLGVMEQTHAQHVSMATVCRITRNTVFPPQLRTPQEWFHYAFCTSELDNVNRFPSMDRSDSLVSSSSEGKRSSPRLHDHSHSTETIFAFPSMQIHLNSKHLQKAVSPDFMGERPKVECSLVTEFQDHIFVAVDAESFFFLHDLINSYVKDTKEKMSQNEDEKGDIEKKGKVITVNEPTQLLQQDWREFTCTTWHLEPTVRLLSWATKNLEPYGVDYILHKLGFSHARSTIPKWLQRGCMDPLDKVVSLLMTQMIIAIHDHDNGNKRFNE